MKTQKNNPQTLLYFKNKKNNKMEKQKIKIFLYNSLPIQKKKYNKNQIFIGKIKVL